MGDIAFSNVGLYKPSSSIYESGLLQVESTYTFSPPALPNYEFVCCNTTLDGTMTLSMVTDEIMGRDTSSCQALLNDIKEILRTLIV
mmetsp:Transcript_7235/g.13364  ORF Transcript_7235/g.13364 Transcript_7235/m.13364 type:complete len:87 (+) Transcript_7235:15-275(+)